MSNVWEGVAQNYGFGPELDPILRPQEADMSATLPQMVLNCGKHGDSKYHNNPWPPPAGAQENIRDIGCGRGGETYQSTEQKRKNTSRTHDLPLMRTYTLARLEHRPSASKTDPCCSLFPHRAHARSCARPRCHPGKYLGTYQGMNSPRLQHLPLGGHETHTVP